MNGFYNLIKPLGFSSGDLVNKLKGILRKHLGKKCKVGHLGTLDPQATGVLGVAVGSATKLFDYFLTKRKIYVATCVLGKETDTLDSAGTVIEEKTCVGVTAEQFIAAMKGFLGEIEQIPPAYSAKSIGGVKAYRIARKGEVPTLAPCRVTIYDLEYLDSPLENTFRFRITCSGGTYIRSLCRDIGHALGYPAYMGSLIRTQNGDMSIEDAVEITDLESDVTKGFTTLEKYGEKLPSENYPESLRKKIENGVKVPSTLADGMACIRINEAFYAIGEVRSGEMRVIARDLCD